MGLNVVIAGAGIGGLTAAIALERRGIAARVLERSPELRPVGAGLALQPNAMLVLRGLGIERDVVRAGAVQRRVAIVDPSGRSLGAETDVARIYPGLDVHTVALHRARLQAVLLQALGRQPELGAGVTGYESEPDGIRVRTSRGEVIDADLLVAADGLHSAVRAHMMGAAEPVYAGYTSWRGVTPSGTVPQPSRMTEAWGRGLRFGIAGIGADQIYWFAVANAPAGGRDGRVHDELRARFGHWHAPVWDVIAATPARHIIRTDIVDRPPVDRWHDGRSVLLGDAAHPMTPNLGQGAGQAIEDASALADAVADLAGPGGTPATSAAIASALRRYEARRVPRANAFVRASRRFGEVGQWEHPVATWLRNRALRLMPASAQIRQARKLLQNT